MYEDVLFGQVSYSSLFERLMVPKKVLVTTNTSFIQTGYSPSVQGKLFRISLFILLASSTSSFISDCQQNIGPLIAEYLKNVSKHIHF